MSRTYRRAKGKDKYLVTGRYGVLHTYVGHCQELYLDIHSAEAKKNIKRFQSDSGNCWINFRGPSWFLREFVQVPYRAKARQELMKWMKNPDHEVLIESKPTKDVYWL